MDKATRNRMAAQAQGRALAQLCRENVEEYRVLYEELIEAGYLNNTTRGGPKAQPRAQTQMAKRHPRRYRELYIHYKYALYLRAGGALVPQDHDDEDVAMQMRCIHCGREQWAITVAPISHGEAGCAWCGEFSRPMTLKEYRAIMKERQADPDRTL